MDSSGFRVEACTVAVTPVSVILTLRTDSGNTLSLTMPRAMGEKLALTLEAGFANVPGEAAQ